MQEALSKARQLNITVTGRKTGQVRTAPVWFVPEGDRVYLLPLRGSRTEWYKNVLANPGITLSVGKASIQGQARAITAESEVSQVVDTFGRRYSPGAIKRWYHHRNVAVEVTLPKS